MSISCIYQKKAVLLQRKSFYYGKKEKSTGNRAYRDHRRGSGRQGLGEDTK